MLNLLFPIYCVNCQKPSEYLCTQCIKKLKQSLPECYICRRLSPKYLTHKKCIESNLKAVFVGWRYDDIAKKILSEFKYRYAYKISKILAKLLIDRLKETDFIKLLSPDHVLMPIPSHISHIRKRGYNQSLLIARRVSDALQLPLLEDFIIRDKDSRHQSNLNSKKRRNIGNVFKLTRALPDKKVILIDDVITTGTTLNRAAKALNKKNVQAITLFRGAPHYQPAR